jgi:peptidoglycan/LPS O-acetylase OafA/YrhL
MKALFMNSLSVSKTPHLKFIDGMRGFAALYVVIYHAVKASNVAHTTLWWRLFAHAHAVVTVFIAISGFCLMLPVVKNGWQSDFFRRRAYRILPPYYLILFIAILGDVLSGEPSTKLALWSHLLMVHNWFNEAQFAYDASLWSVAMECQIYLLFPLMVFGWRRIGPTWTLIMVGVLAHAGYHMTGNNVYLNYFFIFALGMLGADLAYRGKSLRLIEWISVASLIGYFLAVPTNKVDLQDIFIGLFASMFMAAGAMGGMKPLRSLFSGRVIVWLGTFSYSIYLVHGVVQNTYLRTGTHSSVLVLVFGVTPIVLAASYLFYLVAEKPSIKLAKRQTATVGCQVKTGV